MEEWERNLDLYQGYLTEDLATVSQTFLQNGVYAGDTGDLMVLTLSNILRLPITIVTSVQNMPVVCVMPTSSSVISTQPIFVTYTQSGPGHYDAVVLGEDTSDPHKKTIKCNCGRKSNFQGQACLSLRYKCFREKKGCSQLCKCKYSWCKTAITWQDNRQLPT